MQPSFPVVSPKYPCRHRWSWLVVWTSSKEDMAAQGGLAAVLHMVQLTHPSGKAWTSQASFSWSPTSGTATNSFHQLGISHVSTFHSTHWWNSLTGGSGGNFPSSSSEFSIDTPRKQATSNPILVALPSPSPWQSLFPCWTKDSF